MADPINTYAGEVMNQGRPIGYWRLGEKWGYAAAIFSDSPDAYWAFGDPVGLTFFDSATKYGVNQNVITRAPYVPTLSDPLDPVIFGVPGALANGSGGIGLRSAANQTRGVVTGPHLDTTTTCTFEWFFTLSGDTNLFQPILCANGSGGVAGVGVYYDGSVRKIDVWFGGAHHRSTTALTVGQTYHVTVVIAAGSGTFYINGVADGTFTTFPGFTIDTVFHEDGAGKSLTTPLLDDLAFYRGIFLQSTRPAVHYALRTSTVIGGGTPPLQDSAEGAGHPLTLIGSATLMAAGWTGDGDAAISFSATAGALYVSNLAALDVKRRVSIECAFKTTSAFAITDGYLVSKRNVSALGGYALSISNTKVRLAAWTKSGETICNFVTGSAYNDGNWHHVVGVVDAVSLVATIYIDGSSVATAAIPLGIGDIGSAGAMFYVSGLSSGSPIDPQEGGGLDSGTIDEVAVYDYGLSASEVATHFARRNTTAATVGFSQARANVMRSGASRCGYFDQRAILLLGSIDVSAHLDQDTLTVVDILNEQPDTASFDVTGIPVLAGQSVVVAIGAPDNRIFGGTVTNPTQKSVRGHAVVKTRVECTDWTFALNELTVTKQYPTGMLPHLVVLDLIANYSTGFTTGVSVKTSAPALTAPLIFKGTPLVDALQQVADAASAAAGVKWSQYVDPYQAIHFFDVEPAQWPKPIVAGNILYDKLDIAQNLLQVRTRIIVEGGGGSTTAPTAAGATSIPVDECGWYDAAGGTLVSPAADIITYTGRSASSGPGNLTGIPASGAGSIVTALLQGDSINLRVTVNDLAAQAALAILTGRSGIREAYFVDGRLNIAGATARANAELAAYKAVNISGNVWSRDQQMRSGTVLRIQLPGRNQSFNAVIQQVTRTPLARSKWQFNAEFAVTWKTLVDLLAA